MFTFHLACSAQRQKAHTHCIVVLQAQRCSTTVLQYNRQQGGMHGTCSGAHQHALLLRFLLEVVGQGVCASSAHGIGDITPTQLNKHLHIGTGQAQRQRSLCLSIGPSIHQPRPQAGGVVVDLTALPCRGTSHNRLRYSVRHVPHAVCRHTSRPCS